MLLRQLVSLAERFATGSNELDAPEYAFVVTITFISLRGRDDGGLARKFSTALVAALATTLVAVSSEWLRQRGQDARLKRDADQATSRITFLSAWLTLQERLSESSVSAFPASREGE